MLSNLSYLLTSKSITLYILYTLHVMLGTSLVFTALYTYGVHSSKAMARAAALEASVQSPVNGMNGMSLMGKRPNDSRSAVEFEEEMDIAIGGLNGMRKAKSMIGLSTEKAAWENKSTGYECGDLKRDVKFREICYGGGVKEGVEMDIPVLGGKGMSVEIS